MPRSSLLWGFLFERGEPAFDHRFGAGWLETFVSQKENRGLPAISMILENAVETTDFTDEHG